MTTTFSFSRLHRILHVSLLSLNYKVSSLNHIDLLFFEKLYRQRNQFCCCLFWILDRCQCLSSVPLLEFSQRNKLGEY